MSGTAHEILTAIAAEAPAAVPCPHCGTTMWTVGPAESEKGWDGTDVHGTAMARPGHLQASDGDTVPGGPPAPLVDHTQYNNQLLHGRCHACGETYWFVEAHYPQRATDNAGGWFLPHQGDIAYEGETLGCWRGDPAIAEHWVVIRMRGWIGDAEVVVDQHMAGPFGTDVPEPSPLLGISICCIDPDERGAWDRARAIIERVTPHAVAHLAGGATARGDASGAEGPGDQ